jgi:hypothetical protein
VRKVLGAKQKDELAELLKLTSPTPKQRARIEELAPGACIACDEKKAPKK